MDFTNLKSTKENTSTFMNPSCLEIAEKV